VCVCACLHSEIEEDSDQVSRKFLDGCVLVVQWRMRVMLHSRYSDIDLKAFLDEFTQKRHLFHLRRCIVDTSHCLICSRHSAKKESLLLKQQREKGK
jgi:hypothetical protein